MIELWHASYGSTLIQIAFLNLIALISPGPDFAIVVRNSLVYSKKTAMMTILGIVSGEIVHLTYILLGVGFIISKNLWLLTIVKILGCCYLLYLGIKLLCVKKTNTQLDLSGEPTQAFNYLSAFKIGFITNLLNPKAILFFIGLFSIVVDLNTPFLILLLYAVVMVFTTLLWFFIVAQFFSNPKIRNRFLNVQHWIERTTGGLLILISIKLALTKEY